MFVFFRDPYAQGLATQRDHTLVQANMTPTRLAPRDSRSLPTTGNRLGGRSMSTDSVYTILIRLPGEPGDNTACSEGPSIKMIPEVRVFIQ